MNPKQLFWGRCLFYYKKQWNTIKGLVDWTIMLYILIPFLVFLGINHYLWWQAPPSWSQFIPLPLVLLLLMLTLISGQIFYFFEPADILYLNQNKTWIGGLMRRGIIAFLIRDIVLTACVILYVSPLFVIRYQLSWENVAAIWGIFFCARALSGYLYQFLSFLFTGLWLSILNWLMKILIYVILLNFFHLFAFATIPCFGLIGVEAALLSFAMIYRLKLHYKWVYDIDRELMKRYRLQSFLAGQAGVKKPILSMKRPIFFRKSQKLFRLLNPVNGTAEVFLKNRLRDGRWLLFYWQMTIYSVIAILVFPGPDYLRVLIFVGTTCLFAYWLKNELAGLMEHAFFNLVRPDNETKLSSVKKVFALLIWPGVLIQSAAIGFMLFHWIGLFGGCLLSFLYKEWLTRLMLNFILLSKERKKEKPSRRPPS